MSWPEIDGTYVVGDAAAPVAVCVLTSSELIAPLAAAPGVAIAGEVQTANLGLERIVLNIVANPAIRFVLICGNESRLFRPGQSLAALVENGIDGAGQVRRAQGYEPVLRTVPANAVERFRRQIELVDWTGELDVSDLPERVTSLAQRRPFSPLADDAGLHVATPGFVSIAPGGRREPLQYDPKGYFVITLDRPAEQVVVRHYRPDHAPAHEMQGRSGSSILLGLIRERLVSQLSHAGYLGAELAKADAALRLGLRYAQDRPLRSDANEGEPRTGGPVKPRMTAPMDAESLALARAGSTVQLVIQVEDVTETGTLAAVLLDPAEAGAGRGRFAPGRCGCGSGGTKQPGWRWADATSSRPALCSASRVSCPSRGWCSLKGSRSSRMSRPSATASGCGPPASLATHGADHGSLATIICVRRLVSR